LLPLKDNVPTRTFPIVTVGLIAVNIIVWIWEFTGTPVDEDVFHYGYYPCTLEHNCVGVVTQIHHLPWYEGVFTSMFMHGSWLHIGGNMLFLWIFGNNVEDAFGRIRFLVWYLAAGIVAAGVQTFVTLAFTDPSGGSIPNIGASGAIAGVLGAYFVFLREIPAVLFLGLWFVFQLWEGGFSILQPQAGGGVAFFAHIGGFAFGLATALLMRKRRPLAPKW